MEHDPLMASIRKARAEGKIRAMELLVPSTDDLDLTALPERLDDETLARVQLIARSPLPPPIPADEQHFMKCLRVMLAVLPKRSADEISGELFVAAYQRKLGHFPDAAISFLADKAMEKCQWFPTIAECLEILEGWRRDDIHTRRKTAAYRLSRFESEAREREERNMRWKDGSPWTPNAAELQAIKDQVAESLRAAN